MRVHAVRFAPGTDLKEMLTRLMEERALRAAFILSGVGSLARAELRMPSRSGEEGRVRRFAGPLEIVALAGTLCPDGVHVHMALSGGDGACVGGHVMAGCIVHTTAEIVVGEAEELAFRRPLDPETGYGELSVEPRGSATAAQAAPPPSAA
jgi:predicted DNA-binding protein with PD1-like motif